MARSSSRGAGMDLGAEGSEARFLAYVEGLVGVIGHTDRAGPLRDYCLGLLMPGERKSVEPLAAVTAPARVAAQHQSLLHFVGNAPWSDARVMAKVREQVLPSIERSGPIEAWIVASLPVAWRLYLPQVGGGGPGAAPEGGGARGRRLRQQARDLAGADPRRGRGRHPARHGADGCPRVTDPAAPPIRPERHIPNSIATLRRRLTVALASTLERCPCCHAPRSPASRKRSLRRSSTNGLF